MMMGKGLALHKALFLVFLPIVSSTIDTTVVGAAFENPTEIGNSETLTFGPVRYVGPTAQFTTRGYNGVFPAPTIRAKAGDTLSINLVNLLEDYDNTVAHNSYQTPNTTNLHTHGLHVSGAGIADNVFVEVEPGHEHNYEIEIPADHMGGTFWYHPHHHGSTTIQAGGGAAGIIIIEDAANEVPPEIAEMEEFNMMLFLASMSTVAAIQASFNDQLWQISGTASDTLLVNGMVQPVVSMQQGKWYRWRMVYASLENTATLTFDSYTGTAACEMQLLAKDGVYLNTAPREVTSLPLFSGARADVAIRCTGVGTATFSAGARRRRNLMQPPPPPGASSYTGTVLTVDVSGDDYGAADLTPFTMNRPCYLADTRSLTADTTSSLSLDAGLQVNGASFSSSTTYLDTFTAGELVELSVSGFGNHPYHQHVNHFQITSITAGDSTYFQEGDWGDTIFDSGDSMTARFYADKFTGPMVVHCHILSHEDQGMMALWNLDGNEGDEYSGARTVDPTCYNETSGSRGGDWSAAPTAAPSSTPAPTLTPTPFDTLYIDVVLSLTASNCNISDDVLIDAFVATLDDISSQDISDFESSCTESLRRKLLKGSTASSTVTSGGASEVAASSRGRKLSASLTASFGIQVSLSATNYTSATAFSSAISSSVTSAISDGTLTSNLNSLCSTCGLTADGATVSEPTRHVPSPVPTSPTQAPHKKKSSSKNSGIEASFTSPVGIAIICAIVAIIIGGGALLRYKLSPSSSTASESQGNGKPLNKRTAGQSGKVFMPNSSKVAPSGSSTSSPPGETL